LKKRKYWKKENVKKRKYWKKILKNTMVYQPKTHENNKKIVKIKNNFDTILCNFWITRFEKNVTFNDSIWNRQRQENRTFFVIQLVIHAAQFNHFDGRELNFFIFFRIFFSRTYLVLEQQMLFARAQNIQLNESKWGLKIYVY